MLTDGSDDISSDDGGDDARAATSSADASASETMPSNEAETKMWLVADAWMHACEAIPEGKKTSAQAVEKNRLFFRAMESVVLVKAGFDRLSPSARSWGESQTWNRLLLSMRRNGISALPLDTKDESKIATWSAIKRNKKAVAAVMTAVGTMFGAGSDQEKRNVIFEGALMESPKAAAKSKVGTRQIHSLLT